MLIMSTVVFCHILNELCQVMSKSQLFVLLFDKSVNHILQSWKCIANDLPSFYIGNSKIAKEIVTKF